MLVFTTFSSTAYPSTHTLPNMSIPSSGDGLLLMMCNQGISAQGAALERKRENRMLTTRDRAAAFQPKPKSLFLLVGKVSVIPDSQHWYFCLLLIHCTPNWTLALSRTQQYVPEGLIHLKNADYDSETFLKGWKLRISKNISKINNC